MASEKESSRAGSGSTGSGHGGGRCHGSGAASARGSGSGTAAGGRHDIPSESGPSPSTVEVYAMTPRDSDTTLSEATAVTVDVLQGLPDEDFEAGTAAAGPSASTSAGAGAGAAASGSSWNPPSAAGDVPHSLSPALEGASPYNANTANMSRRCFDPDEEAPQLATVARVVSLVDRQLRESGERHGGAQVISTPGMDAIVVWNVKLVNEPKELAEAARAAADAAGLCNRGAPSVSVRRDGSICSMNVRAKRSNSDVTAAAAGAAAGSTAGMATPELAAMTIADALIAIREYNLKVPTIHDALVSRLLLIADADTDAPTGGEARATNADAVAERDVLVRRARTAVQKEREEVAARAEAAAASSAPDHSSDSDSSEDSYVVVTFAPYDDAPSDFLLGVYANLLDALVAAALPLPHALVNAFGNLRLMWNADLLRKDGITWFGGLAHISQLSRSGTLVLWDGTEIDCTGDCGMAVAALDLAIWGCRPASYVPRAVVEAIRSGRASESRRRVTVGSPTSVADVAWASASEPMVLLVADAEVACRFDAASNALAYQMLWRNAFARYRSLRSMGGDSDAEASSYAWTLAEPVANWERREFPCDEVVACAAPAASESLHAVLSGNSDALAAVSRALSALSMSVPADAAGAAPGDTAAHQQALARIVGAYVNEIIAPPAAGPLATEVVFASEPRPADDEGLMVSPRVKRPLPSYASHLSAIHCDATFSTRTVVAAVQDAVEAVRGLRRSASRIKSNFSFMVWYLPSGADGSGEDVQLERIISRDTPRFSDDRLFRQSCSSWAMSASETTTKHAKSLGVRATGDSLVRATDGPKTVVLVFSWWKDAHAALVSVVRGVLSSRLGAPAEVAATVVLPGLGTEPALI